MFQVSIIHYVRWFFAVHQQFLSGLLMVLVLVIWGIRLVERHRSTYRSSRSIGQVVQQHPIPSSNERGRPKNRLKSRRPSQFKQHNIRPIKAENLNEHQVIDRSLNKQFSYTEQSPPKRVTNIAYSSRDEVIPYFTPKKQCLQSQTYDKLTGVLNDNDEHVLRDKDELIVIRQGRSGHYVLASDTHPDEENDETLNEITWAFDSSPSGFKSKTQSHFIINEVEDSKNTVHIDSSLTKCSKKWDDTSVKHGKQAKPTVIMDENSGNNRIAMMTKQMKNRKGPSWKIKNQTFSKIRKPSENKAKHQNKHQLAKPTVHLKDKTEDISKIMPTMQHFPRTFGKGKLQTVEKSPPHRVFPAHSENVFEESPIYIPSDRPPSRKPSECNLLKRDSWIWFSKERPSVESFATRRKKFQSSDPRVAKIAAEIELQDQQNKDIERNARSLIESSSMSSGGHKIDSLAFIDGLTFDNEDKDTIRSPLNKHFISRSSPGPCFVNTNIHSTTPGHIGEKTAIDSPWIVKRQIRTLSKSPNKPGQPPERVSYSARHLRVASQSPQRSSVWRCGTGSSNMTRAPGSLAMLSMASSRSLNTSSCEQIKQNVQKLNTSLPVSKAHCESLDSGDPGMSSYKPPIRSLSTKSTIDSKHNSEMFVRKTSVDRCTSSPSCHYDIACSPSRQKNIIREAVSQSHISHSVSLPSGVVDPLQFKSTSLLFSTEDSQMPSDSNPLAEGAIQKEVHGIINNLFSPVISPSPSQDHHRRSSAEKHSTKRKNNDDNTQKSKRHRLNKEGHTSFGQAQQNKHYNNCVCADSDSLKSFSDSDISCKKRSPIRNGSEYLIQHGCICNAHDVRPRKYKPSKIPIAISRRISKSLPETTTLKVKQTITSSRSSSWCDSKRSKPNIFSSDYYLRRKRNPSICKNVLVSNKTTRADGIVHVSKAHVKQSVLTAGRKIRCRMEPMPPWQNNISKISKVTPCYSRYKQKRLRTTDTQTSENEPYISSQSGNHYRPLVSGEDNAYIKSRQQSISTEVFGGINGISNANYEKQEKFVVNVASSNNSSNCTPRKYSSNSRSQRNNRQIRGTPYDRIKTKCQFDTVENISHKRDCNVSKKDHQCIEEDLKNKLTDEQLLLQTHWQYPAHMLSPFYPKDMGLDKPSDINHSSSSLTEHGLHYKARLREALKKTSNRYQSSTGIDAAINILDLTCSYKKHITNEGSDYNSLLALSSHAQYTHASVHRTHLQHSRPASPCAAHIHTANGNCSPFRSPSAVSLPSSGGQAYISPAGSDEEDSEQDTLPPSASDHSVWSCDLSGRSAAARDATQDDVRDDADQTASLSDSGVATWSMPIETRSDTSVSTHADLKSSNHYSMTCCAIKELQDEQYGNELDNKTRPTLGFQSCGSHCYDQDDESPCRIPQMPLNSFDSGLDDTLADTLPHDGIKDGRLAFLPIDSSDDEMRTIGTLLEDSVASIDIDLMEGPLDDNDNEYVNLPPCKYDTSNAPLTPLIRRKKSKGKLSPENEVPASTHYFSIKKSSLQYPNKTYKSGHEVSTAITPTDLLFKSKFRNIEKSILATINHDSSSIVQQKTSQMDATTFLNNLKANCLKTESIEPFTSRTPIKIDRVNKFRELLKKFE